MPSAKPLTPIAGHLNMRVRTVEGPLVTLELAATDYRIVIGQHCDYLVGHGIAHAFSKEGLFILSGPVPVFLMEDAQASLEPQPRRDGLSP